jgi:hypothetical protein
MVEGESYSFKVRASNVYGFGDFSEATEILASSYPEAPQIVSVIANGLQVLISFPTPSDKGDPLTQVTV